MPGFYNQDPFAEIMAVIAGYRQGQAARREEGRADKRLDLYGRQLDLQEAAMKARERAQRKAAEDAAAKLQEQLEREDLDRRYKESQIAENESQTRERERNNRAAYALVDEIQGADPNAAQQAATRFKSRFTAAAPEDAQRWTDTNYWGLSLIHI